MDVELAKIVEGIEFQSDESQAFLNLSTGEVIIYTDEEIEAAENDEDLSGHAEWYREAVAQAKEYIENEDNYLPIPDKFDFNEYRVMEKFISRVPIEEQREELFNSIKGKGAFSRFRKELERFMLIDQWHKYKDEALLDFAKWWCEDNNINYQKLNIIR